MNKFLDSYQLITSEPNSELRKNSLLFSVQNCFLANDPSYINTLSELIERCRVRKGVFNQHPSHALEPRAKHMAHDQLTAIICFSVMYGYSFHTDIWKEIKRQWFRYNNVEVPVTFREKFCNIRLLHPRDVIFYGMVCGNFLWWLLFPVFFVMLFITMWSKKTVIARGAPSLDTDGKLLTFIRLEVLNINWLTKFTNWVVSKRFGSWNFLFKTYYAYNDHPNVIASRDI